MNQQEEIDQLRKLLDDAITIKAILTAELQKATAPQATRPSFLQWKKCAIDGVPYDEATLGDFLNHEGVRFSLTYQPTNNIRGPWVILIETDGVRYHLDNADQTLRYYHDKDRALAEADAIARALFREVKA